MERRLSRLLRVSALALAAGVLVAGGAGASAATTADLAPLPLGTDGKGVHMHAEERGRPPHRHRELVLTFDASAAGLYRRIAGRTLIVDCVRFARGRSLFDQAGGGSSQTAPRRRQAIAVLLRARYDLCSIGVQHGRHTTVLTWVPLTPLGAERLDEANTAKTIIAAVRTLARPERPSAATVAASFHGVALDSPAQLPPPGVLGVFSDGVAHVYAAQIDRAGKLLFLEEEGDVTRTDIVDALVDGELF